MTNYHSKKNSNISQDDKDPIEIEKILRMNLIEDIEDVNVLLKSIELYAEKSVKKVNASQLRNIYSKVLSVKTPTQMQLIRPQLMYVAARQTVKKDDDIARRVILFIEKVVKSIKTESELESFKSFMEAIVAYHKFYEEKSKN